MAGHVALDVVVVEELQNAPVLVAIENDQVEVFDLFGEQFLGRELNERQLVDGCPVLLFRRT